MNLSFPLACAALLTCASLASAQNMFGLISRMDEGTFIEIDVPNVTEAGYLAVYPIVDAQVDRPLGYELVEPGTVVDRRIRLNHQVTTDVMLYLFEGEPLQPFDAAIDSFRVRIEDN